MVQQRLDRVTDSLGLADCQELTFFLYFDQSKTSRRDSVKIYLVDQCGSVTVLIFFFLSHVIILRQLFDTVNFGHFRTALTRTLYVATLVVGGNQIPMLRHTFQMHEFHLTNQ